MGNIGSDSVENAFNNLLNDINRFISQNKIDDAFFLHKKLLEEIENHPEVSTNIVEKANRIKLHFERYAKHFKNSFPSLMLQVDSLISNAEIALSKNELEKSFKIYNHLKESYDQIPSLAYDEKLMLYKKISSLGSLIFEKRKIYGNKVLNSFVQNVPKVKNESYYYEPENPELVFSESDESKVDNFLSTNSYDASNHGTTNDFSREIIDNINLDYVDEKPKSNGVNSNSIIMNSSLKQKFGINDFFSEAIDAYNSKDYIKSRDCFSKILKGDPNNAKAKQMLDVLDALIYGI